MLYDLRTWQDIQDDSELQLYDKVSNIYLDSIIQTLLTFYSQCKHRSTEEFRFCLQLM
jgi:hypothetical protein